ncbi:MAG TPA: hypothetical protein VFU47_16820 [Armatimonadota bacterium]|nr:hypothetical protein [Armatimonadota bacterium]
MNLLTALDEFELLQRRRHRGEQGQLTAMALAALREYLVDYSAFEETEALSSEDLFEFLLEYYPAQEEPDPDVALVLLDAAGELALWLVERGDRQLAGFAGQVEHLRRELPRVLEALAILQEHARREDLPPPVLASAEDDGQEIGEIGSGVNRVARLDQVDYDQAETDEYTVDRVEDGALRLSSAAREALGSGPAVPVRVPEQAAERLRPGDRIHAEIAPGPDGWELLEVFGVRPGKYA